jgi:hypothetical protein
MSIHVVLAGEFIASAFTELFDNSYQHVAGCMWPLEYYRGWLVVWQHVSFFSRGMQLYVLKLKYGGVCRFKCLFDR